MMLRWPYSPTDRDVEVALRGDGEPSPGQLLGPLLPVDERTRRPEHEARQLRVALLRRLVLRARRHRDDWGFHCARAKLKCEESVLRARRHRDDRSFTCARAKIQAEKSALWRLGEQMRVQDIRPCS